MLMITILVVSVGMWAQGCGVCVCSGDGLDNVKKYVEEKKVVRGTCG